MQASTEDNEPKLDRKYDEVSLGKYREIADKMLLEEHDWKDVPYRWARECAKCHLSQPLDGMLEHLADAL